MIASIVPKDLPLAIPGNITFFEVLIVVSFLLHILFVNITIGTSTLSVIQEWKSIRLKDKVRYQLAQSLATNTSILKSLAVVLGIAPLLIISVIYSQFFFSSTILIGKIWLSLIIILAVAFLMLYWYKFSWKRYEQRPYFHLSIGIVGTALLLFVPLIFIVNVVSMLYPEMWRDSQGFWHALFYYPQIWQRYAHFILATFAVSGLYVYGLYSFLNKKKSKDYYNVATKLGLSVAFWTTVLQFGIGFILLLSQESYIIQRFMGGNVLSTFLLATSVLLSGLFLLFLYQLQKKQNRTYILLSLTSFLFIIGLMGWMRHDIREAQLQPYQEESPRTMVVTQP